MQDFNLAERLQRRNDEIRARLREARAGNIPYPLPSTSAGWHAANDRLRWVQEFNLTGSWEKFDRHAARKRFATMVIEKATADLSLPLSPKEKRGLGTLFNTLAGIISGGVKRLTEKFNNSKKDLTPRTAGTVAAATAALALTAITLTGIFRNSDAPPPPAVTSPPVIAKVEQPDPPGKILKPVTEPAKLQTMDDVIKSYENREILDGGALVIYNAARKGQLWAMRSMANGLLNGKHGFERRTDLGVIMMRELAIAANAKTDLTLQDKKDMLNWAYITSVKRFEYYGAEYNPQVGRDIMDRIGGKWHVPGQVAAATPASLG